MIRVWLPGTWLMIRTRQGWWGRDVERAVLSVPRIIVIKTKTGAMILILRKSERMK